MAAITNPGLAAYGVASFAPVELTGSDTLSVKKGALYIYNTTASPVNIVIDGDEGTTVNTKEVGVVSVASGYTVACPVDQVTRVNLGDISGYLSGDVDVTGGASGVFAWVM